MNKFIVTGNLTKDASINDRNTCIKMTIINTTGFGEYENKNFFNIDFYGKNMEKRLQVFKKGATILADCEIEVKKGNDGKYYTNYKSMNVEIVKFAKNDNQESSDLDF